MSESQPATLIWIGPREGTDFSDAYQDAERNAGQIAHRVDIADALLRPATDVAAIVVASRRRLPESAARGWNDHARKQLARRHPVAGRLQILGPLCEGWRDATAGWFDAGRVAWHHGSDAMRRVLAEQFPQPRVAFPRGIAVVADHYAAAEPLVDLAEQLGAVVVWVRSAIDSSIRNFEEVWWLTPTPPQVHGSSQQRQSDPTRRHFWLTASTSAYAHQQARDAGIDEVVSATGVGWRLPAAAHPRCRGRTRHAA